ncbi:MFS transporter [Streptomyces roseolilacinus]|uniref:MFS transporter n=1 Tax=Streptomyces roseolilacinus TaxID=66904 RepID=A0A918B0K5_9ACTN|nr:MFS transporter [Streptomyces roseolilacinus]GGQ09834.1 MFS transporter [Streptomyces roseolilacinus]
MSDDGSEKVRKWWAFAGLGTLSFLGCIDLTIVSTAAPVIQDDLGATVTELQLIVNVFVVALSTGMVTMGRLADSHGRRKVLYTGAAVFCAASLGAGFATVPEWLIAFRFLQGAACAVLYTATGALVTAIFPPHERGKAIGCLYGVNGLGLASGPVLGGFLVGSASWSWVFWMNVPLVAVALAVCLPTVPESYGEKMTGGMDWPGLALLSLSVPALVLALTLGHVWGWSSPGTVALLLCGGAALVAFRAVELRAQNPLIRFQLFAGRDFLGAVTADFALAFFYCVVLFLMPLYLHAVRGLDGHTTGLLLLPCTAAVAVLSPFVGRLVDRHGPRRMLCLGFLALALSALAQARLTPATGMPFLVSALVAMGVGWALVLGPATVAALSAVPGHLAGTAVGASWTCHNLGGALGLAVGMEVYRLSARDALDDRLAGHGLASGPWAGRVVENPQDGPALLRHHTGLTAEQAGDLFGVVFTSGARAAMWLLLGVALAALAVIALGLRPVPADSAVRRGEPAATRSP